MSHQPFETWNLDRTSLTPEERVELEHHIASCPVCQQTKMNWDHANLEIRKAERKIAPSGFAVRFQNSLVERRRLAHNRQVRKILTILCLSLAGIILILTGYFIATTPPIDWIGSIFQSITNVSFNLREIFYIITFWALEVSPLVLIAIGVIPFTWTMVLIVTGAITFTRFHLKGETLR